MIDQNTIEDVKNRVDIEEVVSDFVSLKRKGQNLWACCPFHNEKSPSFSISPAKGFYKCFGCGKGGDSIDFVMEIEKLPYLEAIRYLAKKYGIEIKEEELTDDEVKEQSERESLLIALNFAKNHYIEQLWNTDIGRSIGLNYFHEREIPDDIIKSFELGYSEDSWDGLLKSAKAQGHSEEFLELAGLLVRKEARVYDRFRGRVIFPIHNIAGRVVAFGARALKKDDKPKYINSPETPVYHKSDVLYGLYQSKQEIRRSDNCYLVEGYTDVTSLHQVGVQNVVSSSGTSLTEGQLKLISRFSKNVTILYDGDQAGIKASLRGVDLILEKGLNVKVVPLPEGEDPDSYSKQLGANAFREYLDSKVVDFIHFKSNLILDEVGNDPIKKADAIKDIVGSISKIPESLKRAVYIKEAASILEIAEPTLVGEMNNALLKSKKVAQKAEVAKEAQQPEIEKQQSSWSLESLIALQEKESIRLLVKFGINNINEEDKLYQYLFSELEDVVFLTPVYAEIFDMFKTELAKDNAIDEDYLIKNGSADVRKTVIDIVHSKYEISEHWSGKYKIHVPTEKEEEVLEHSAYTNVLRLKQRLVRKIVEENLEKIKLCTNQEDLTELMQIHHQLKQTEVEIAKSLGNVILH